MAELNSAVVSPPAAAAAPAALGTRDFILKLPNELLHQIFGDLSESIENDPSYNDAYTLSQERSERGNAIRRTNSDFAMVALTCKRFSRVAMPHLYEKLFVENFGLGLRQGRLLHRTLHEKPPLRQYCRKMMLWKIQDDVSLVDDIVFWQGNTTTAILYTDESVESNSISQLIGLIALSMPFLTKLDIYLKGNEVPNFAKVLRVIDVLANTPANASLRQLTLYDEINFSSHQDETLASILTVRRDCNPRAWSSVDKLYPEAWRDVFDRAASICLGLQLATRLRSNIARMADRLGKAHFQQMRHAHWTISNS